jgi:hypothetical protein
MILSDDKVMHMSHVVLRELLDKDTVDITEEDGKVRHAIRRAIVAQLKLGEMMDEAVRKKIESLSRHVAESSPEWDVLYSKYFIEEQTRHGIKE